MSDPSGFRHQPSPEELRSALGSLYPLWERLTRFLEARVGLTSQWSPWGPAGFGWGFRVRKGGRALVALYPQPGRIMAQIVLGRAQAERALELEFGGNASRILREAPQLRDGRWLSIPVLTEADVEDVEQLLAIKMRPVGGPAKS